jgi:hypothetical protein
VGWGTSRRTGTRLANELAIGAGATSDRVYAELVTAGERAALVQEDGLARGRTDRTGDVRDEETTGLFERDALVYRAARRRADLDREHEGLVFGRLDCSIRRSRAAPAGAGRLAGRSATSGASASATTTTSRW